MIDPFPSDDDFMLDIVSFSNDPIDIMCFFNITPLPFVGNCGRYVGRAVGKGSPVEDGAGVGGGDMCGSGVGVTGAEVTGSGVTGEGVAGAGVTGARVTGAGVTGEGVTGAGVT